MSVLRPAVRPCLWVRETPSPCTPSVPTQPTMPGAAIVSARMIQAASIWTETRLSPPPVTADPARFMIDCSATAYYNIGTVLAAPSQDETLRAQAVPEFGETITMTNSQNLRIRGGFTSSDIASIIQHHRRLDQDPGRVTHGRDVEDQDALRRYSKADMTARR